MVDELFKQNRINPKDIAVKRVKRYVTTVIYNTANKQLARTLKKLLACGGSVTDNKIVLQGNHRAKCLEILRDKGLLETSLS